MSPHPADPTGKLGALVRVEWSDHWRDEDATWDFANDCRWVSLGTLIDFDPELLHIARDYSDRDGYGAVLHLWRSQVHRIEAVTGEGFAFVGDE